MNEKFEDCGLLEIKIGLDAEITQLKNQLSAEKIISADLEAKLKTEEANLKTEETKSENLAEQLKTEKTKSAKIEREYEVEVTKVIKAKGKA